jgi:hypothetical protein
MRRGNVGAGALLLGLTVGRPCLAEVTTVVEPPAEGAVKPPEQADSTNAAETPEDEPPASGDRIAAVEEPERRRTRSTADIDARIAALREERRQYGLGGPITLLAIGSGVAFVSGYVYVLSAGVCHSDCEPPTTLLGVGVIGLGVGIWGAVWLGDRIGDRRRNSRAIRELEAQKAEYEVSVVPALGPDGAGMQMRVVF